ncbi:hypothetical protein BWR59_16895 [Pseudomonas sp. Bc-h]|nr:hypothetical protein BWR59_16895 [Pseudomonas sp. Bc-h]
MRTDVKERKLKIWNDLLEHEARRVCAIEHWAGGWPGTLWRWAGLVSLPRKNFGKAGARRRCLQPVAEELLTREWLQVKAAKKLEKGEG